MNYEKFSYCTDGFVRTSTSHWTEKEGANGANYQTGLSLHDS